MIGMFSSCSGSPAELGTWLIECYRLVREEEGGNWLYSIDQLAPIEI